MLNQAGTDPARWSDEEVSAVIQSAAFRTLYRKRETLRWGLAGTAFAIAASFTLLMCFTPSVMTAPLVQGGQVTWGLFLGAMAMLAGVMVGAIYVLLAERFTVVRPGENS